MEDLHDLSMHSKVAGSVSANNHVTGLESHDTALRRKSVCAAIQAWGKSSPSRTAGSPENPGSTPAGARGSLRRPGALVLPDRSLPYLRVRVDFRVGDG